MTGTEGDVSDVQLILLLSLVGGALSLDATAAFQMMLSQPLVAASIAGLVVGDATTGLVVGAALQLVWMGVLPVGAAAFPDGAVSGVCGVGASVLLARSGVPAGLAVACGIGIALVAGAVGQRVTTWVRRANVRYSNLAEARAEDGDPGGVRTAVILGLGTRFVASAILAAAALAVSLLLKPLAALHVPGVFPTTLWAAPIGAAALMIKGKGVEKYFIAAGLVAGLAMSFLA